MILAPVFARIKNKFGLSDLEHIDLSTIDSTKILEIIYNQDNYYSQEELNQIFNQGLQEGVIDGFLLDLYHQYFVIVQDKDGQRWIVHESFVRTDENGDIWIDTSRAQQAYFSGLKTGNLMGVFFMAVTEMVTAPLGGAGVATKATQKSINIAKVSPRLSKQFKLNLPKNKALKTYSGKSIDFQLTLPKGKLSPKGKIQFGKGFSRFIAKSGQELRRHLDKLKDLPIGITYNKKLYRYKPSKATYSVTDINPKMIPKENRYRNGLYLSTDQKGINLEVLGYGGRKDKTLYEITNVKLTNLLDLTDSKVIEKLGVTFEQLGLINTKNKYEYTHVIADWAKKRGYNGLKFNGAQGSKKYININIFEQANVDKAINSNNVKAIKWLSK